MKKKIQNYLRRHVRNYSAQACHGRWGIIFEKAREKLQCTSMPWAMGGSGGGDRDTSPTIFEGGTYQVKSSQGSFKVQVQPKASPSTSPA